MWAFVIFMIYLGLGASFLYIGIDEIIHGDIVGFFSLIISVIMIGAPLFITIERRKSNSFLKGLTKNNPAIRSGNHLRYEDMQISPATEVVQFEICLSWIIVSHIFYSSPLIKGQHGVLRTRLICLLLTLCLGWWGLPWGPVWTLKVLRTNILGGEKLTMAEFIRREE